MPSEVNVSSTNGLPIEVPGVNLAEQELLPLDAAERVVTFRSEGKTYRHIFNRITAKDWEDFFAHIVAEFKQERNGYSQVVDTDNASLVLYTRAVKRVEGYRVRNGSALETLSDWKERIPQHHRMAVADLFMRAGRSEEGDDSMIDSEGATVTLDALWNEAAPGEMKRYKGLVHRFSAPTAEHRRRFLKSKNRAFIAGGSRTGVTMVPSAHLVLVKLYDELIEGVDGYGLGGRALASREQIAREMDAYHKAAAVGQLFPTSLRVDVAEQTDREKNAE